LKSPPETFGQQPAVHGEKRAAPGNNITQVQGKKTTKVNDSIRMEPVAEEERGPEEGPVRPTGGQSIVVRLCMSRVLYCQSRFWANILLLSS